MTSKEICQVVKKKFGVSFTTKGMTHLLHRLDFSYRKPKHVPGKANQEAHEEFLERYKDLKETKETYNIEDHRVVIEESEWINAQSTMALFEILIREQPMGMIYIILDNARYYRSQLFTDFLRHNSRIQLLFLRPCIPNLNVIERLLRFSRN